LSTGSTVVEHLTHNSKIEGSNPVTGMRREIIAKIFTWVEKIL
jgi:hypothetical protein